MRRLSPMLVAVALVGCTDLPVQGRIASGAPASEPIPSVPSTTLDPSELNGVTRLRLGVTPYLAAAAIERQFRPIAGYLSRCLGVPVDLVPTKSYDALIELVERDGVDIAILSPLSYVVAKERVPDLRLIASELAAGSVQYSSLILVRDGDPARSLADLKGRRIAFVDEHSTTGFLYPWDAFLRAGIDPTREFGSVLFEGTHPGAIQALIDEEADAACVASGMLDVAQGDLPVETRSSLDPGRVRVLATVGRVRYDTLCLRGGLSQSAAAKIAAAFGSLSRQTAVGRRVLAEAHRITGWVAAKDEDYAPIREVKARVEAQRMVSRNDRKTPPETQL